MIELHKLAAGYPERRVLEQVSLQFPDGQITVLAGPNASGKTTLLRTILGLEPRLEGEIFLDGTAQTDLTARELALRVSYLPQSRPVPNIAAGRMVLHGRFPYLGYPRRYRLEDWAMAKAALREAGAEELERQLMSRLSGGQRQRVYLAMLLAQDTRNVLLDEPTTYLDVAHQFRLLNCARRLADQGRAVVLVLHDLCLSLRWADQLAVLDSGRLQMADSPERVFTSGILDRVFEVNVRRFQTPNGWQYYCEGKTPPSPQ